MKKLNNIVFLIVIIIIYSMMFITPFVNSNEYDQISPSSEELPLQPQQPPLLSNSNEKSKGPTTPTTTQDQSHSDDSTETPKSENTSSNIEEGGKDNNNPLISLTTEDIYFNIDWKCNTQDMFINDMGYYDLASELNAKKNCHVFKTPCDEIVSLNITDCPGSQPFNSSCKFILNYYRDTIKCDNIPVLVTDFSCGSFGKHHDLGAIDIVCKKFEILTEDPIDTSFAISSQNLNSGFKILFTFILSTFLIYILI